MNVGVVTGVNVGVTGVNVGVVTGVNVGFATASAHAQFKPCNPN